MGTEVARVDGNALGGALGEVFVHEMTSARIACAGCGKVEPIAAEHAYLQTPGIVLRCCHCDGALLVVTRTERGYVLGFRGSGWLEIIEKP